MGKEQKQEIENLPIREGDISASTLNPTLDFSQERNMGFNTATRRSELQANTTGHVLPEGQVYRVGGHGTSRLLDAVRIEGVTIPRNTALYGMSRIDGIRLQVVVSSIEYGGRIFGRKRHVLRFGWTAGAEHPPIHRERRAIKEALAFYRAECR